MAWVSLRVRSLNGFQNDRTGPAEPHLCFPVYSAAHAFTAAYKLLLQSFALTYLQYLVLLVLWQNNGVSVKEIGSRLYLNSGTLKGAAAAAGYVRRERSPADERQLRVKLTQVT